MKLFGIDIAKLINDNIGAGLLDLRLTKLTPGNRTTGSLAAGNNPTDMTVTGKGILEDFEQREIDGTVVKAGDKKALIIGDSLPSGSVPANGDTLIIEGMTLKVVRVISRDPAAATYVVQVRG